MAQDVWINGITYQSVPEVQIPLDGTGRGHGDPEYVVFTDTSDATLDSGNKMLSGSTAYANGTLYTGTITTKAATDMTVSGATVTAPAGYYSTASSKSVASGSATTPATTITANPTISVNSSTGVITATTSATKSVTPTISAGYVSTGTAGTITVSGTNTQNMTVKAAATFTPTTSAQTIAAGTYLTGVQTISGDSNLKATNIKSGVSIFGVAGTLTSADISQDSVTKVLTIE